MTLETNAHLDAATTAALRLFAERIRAKYDVAVAHVVITRGIATPMSP